MAHDHHDEHHEAAKALDADLEVAAREALAEALARPAARVLTPAQDVTPGSAPSGMFVGFDFGSPEADAQEAPRSPQRGRRRWVYTDGGVPLAEPIEVGEEWTGADRGGVKTSEAEIYGNLRATDGTPLDTRKKHRDYLKNNGLVMRSDYTEHLQKAARERARAFTDPSYGREERVAAINNSWDRLASRRRK